MKLARRLHRLRFFVSDAWDECTHSPGVNVLALATLTSALFLAGLAMLLISNVAQRVQLLREDIRVQVYLKDEISAEQRRALFDELAAFDGVARVDYLDKQDALRRYRGWAGDMTELIEELELNPLPASFEVVLQPGLGGEQIGERIARNFSETAGVDDVRFNRGLVRRLEALLRLARIGGTGLGMLIFTAVVFVMASVLRLAVYARRDEIEIMQLVGATQAFVRGPFLVAGLAHGLVSSVLALLLVETARRGVHAYAGGGSLALLDLLAGRPLPGELAGLLILVGLAVSFAGSYFAVRRHFFLK
jgi:cell division transport system permease protein